MGVCIIYLTFGSLVTKLVRKNNLCNLAFMLRTKQLVPPAGFLVSGTGDSLWTTYWRLCNISAKQGDGYLHWSTWAQERFFISFFSPEETFSPLDLFFVCDVTFLDLCKDPICRRSLGLPALLVGPVLLLLLAGAGGRVRASPTSFLLSPAATARHVPTSGATAAGHLQALGTNGPPVTGIATAAGVWIWGVPLPAWSGNLGDDTGLNSPRRESGRVGDLKQRAQSHLLIIR